MTQTEFVTTILASASVSAALTATIIWLAKSWIGERIKGAIQHEYNQKLESHKAVLKVEHDRDLEQLKSDLGEASAERTEPETEKITYTRRRGKQRGDDCVIVPSITDPAEIAKKFPKGHKELKPYLRMTPQPNK